MRINTNTAAMNTYTNLTSANASKSSSLAKLSSGLRINKAGDDAAGLAISEKMKNQISGMTQASRNAQDGISLIQTAEGALSETHSILNRMRDLTVQAGNGTNTDDDKTAIQAELTSLTEEIDRISDDTEFNTQGLMNAGKVTDSSTLDAANPDYKALTVAYNDGTGASIAVDFDKDTGAEALGKLSDSELNKVIESYNSTNNITIAEADGGVSGTADLSALAKNYDEVNGTTGTTFADVGDAETALSELTTNQKANVAKKYNSENNLSANDLKTTESTEFSFQIGANAGEKISVEIENMSAKGLGIADLDVNSETQTADDILGKLDKAIESVSSQRANLGAVQNRLDHTVSNLATTKENLSEANSRITDVDMAEEMMSFTKSNILSQASTSMLAQANQMPQSVLSLLQ
ncbi:flagellin [Carnobacterium alterfunditum]|uniref:Flagellin n=1 Tax=Carnobacterium alterfunditum TaxID=28230 RepID=A0A1N6I4W4_9LACT|nr:flagellin [Carnobacterium alterfunditum]SIO27074.1 flagellin [Carnobacterium alterfunditum]